MRYLVKYLLQTSSENNRTLTVHIRHLSQKYGLEDSLSCLKRDPTSKSTYKEMIATNITSYYECSAEGNDLMKYLNVSTFGLRGRRHPALSNLITTKEVKQSRPHIKFLVEMHITRGYRFGKEDKKFYKNFRKITEPPQVWEKAKRANSSDVTEWGQSQPVMAGDTVISPGDELMTSQDQVTCDWPQGKLFGASSESEYFFLGCFRLIRGVWIPLGWSHSRAL